MFNVGNNSDSKRNTVDCSGFEVILKLLWINVSRNNMLLYDNDFIFDNQFILQSFKCGFEIDEIYCPAKYEKSSSSINFKRSLKYGLLVLWYSIVYKFK